MNEYQTVISSADLRNDYGVNHEPARVCKFCGASYVEFHCEKDETGRITKGQFVCPRCKAREPECDFKRYSKTLSLSDEKKGVMQDNRVRIAQALSYHVSLNIVGGAALGVRQDSELNINLIRKMRL